MSSPLLVTADDLAAKAEYLDSIELLPELMLRLIQSEAQTPTQVFFRLGKGIGFRGSDGEVRSPVQTARIPRDDSVWEVTTRADQEAKADEDIAKQLLSLGSAAQTTTFVGVTLRRWSGKATWAGSQQGWREVRYLDADDLYAWLLEAPVVHIWLSQRMGFPVTGVRTLSDWIDDWARPTTPQFGRDWLLCGRSEQVLQTLNSVGTTGMSFLVAGSEDEAVAFLASAMFSSSDEDTQRILLKTVVVEASDQVEHVANRLQQCIIVAKCDLTDSQQGLVLRANKLVLLQHTGRPSHIDIPLISVPDLVDVLERDGLDRRDAWDAATKARNGVQHLRQHLGAPQRFFEKLRVEEPDPRPVTAVLLVDRWNDESEFDQSILSELSGMSYPDLRAWILSLPSDVPPLLRRSGPIWFLTDPPEAWNVFGAISCPEVLDRFRGTVDRVVGEHDPSFEMAPDDRWTANLHGKSPNYSQHLKIGIARTLSLLAVQNPSLGSVLSGEVLAAGLVRSLLENATPERWYSLGSTLPLLAESAPDEFLSLVEHELAKDEPSIYGLVAASGSVMTSSTRHYELLWALERLAWSREHLARAALILADLAARGFGESGNNPQNSLKAIFLPWHPCTQASVDERLQVVDLIRARHPAVAWNLLLSQLPEHHSTTMSTDRPRVRSWAPGEVAPQTRRDLVRAGLAALDRLLVEAAQDPRRWSELAGATLGLKGGWECKVLDGLDDLPDRLTQEAKQELWGLLREHWHRHRRHPDAEWAMTPESLARIEALLLRLTPTDLVIANIWLFQQWVDLPEQWDEENHDYEDEKTRLAKMRLDVVRQVFETRGTEGLLQLAAAVEAPWFVGLAAAELSVWGESNQGPFLAMCLSDREAGRHWLATGYAGKRIEAMGLKWAEQVVSNGDYPLTPDQRAGLLLCAPAQRETWNLVESLGGDTVGEYWRRVASWSLPHVGEDGRIALGKLIEVGREVDVIDIIAMSAKAERRDFYSDLAVRALEALRANIDDRKEALPRISHDLGDVVDSLAADPSVDLHKLAALEFYFTPIMDMLRAPAALGAALSAQPETLIELVTVVFKKDSEEAAEGSEYDSARWSSAYRILQNWSRLPGAQADGSIDEAKLLEYVEAVRGLAAAKDVDRLGGVDIALGKVLASSPIGGDGVWPHPAVRSALEAVRS